MLFVGEVSMSIVVWEEAIMEYDFKTLVDRTKMDSEKWNMMKAANPEVGEGVSPFSVADMDLMHPPEFVEAMKEYMDKVILGYGMPGDGYYEAVMGWMERRHNWHIKKEWIVITPGIIPAIYNLVQMFTKKNEGVIVLTPVYYPFFSAIKSNGRQVVESPLNNSDGTYKIDFDDLEKKAQDPNNKLILFCSPHNPVGRVWHEDEIKRVGEICLENDVKIVSDEIHFDLIMPGNKHTVFASISDEFRDNVVTCTAPSKSFNLAGMMTSNIIVPNENLRKGLKKQLDKNGLEVWSPLGFEACRISYTKCESWLDQLIQHIDSNQKALRQYLQDNLPEVKLYPLEGTYLSWMDFNFLGMSNKDLEKFMTMDAHVFFDEGYIFGETGSGFERMNIACPTQNMIDAMERIKTALGNK